VNRGNKDRGSALGPLHEAVRGTNGQIDSGGSQEGVETGINVGMRSEE